MSDLVFIHGFLGSSLNWGPTIHRLKKAQSEGFVSKDWAFSAVDLLGHGARKAPPEVKLDLNITVDDLEKQLPKSPFYVVAHSFGLRPALAYAKRYPTQIKALIVEDAAPELSQFGYQFLKKIFTQTPEEFSSRQEAKQYFDTEYGENSAMSRFLLSQIREKENKKLSWRFRVEQMLGLLEESFTLPLWEEWQSFDAPIVLIVGENSNYMNEERVAKSIQLRHGKPIKTHQISQCGHWVHSEQLEQFCQIVIKEIGQF